MAALSETAQELLSEVESAVDLLANSGQELAAVTRAVRQAPSDASELLEEWSELAVELQLPVFADAGRYVVSTYAWAAVFLLVSACGRWLGWPAIARLAVVVEPWLLLAIAFALFPAYMYWQNRKTTIGRWSKRDRRWRLVQWALVAGAVSGFTTSHLHLSFMPAPIFLQPLILALFASIWSSAFSCTNRRLYLIGTVGLSYATVLLLGLFIFQQRNISFLLHTSTMMATVFWQFQVTIARASLYLPTTQSTWEAQLRVVYVQLLTEWVLMLALGSPPAPRPLVPAPPPQHELLGFSLCCGSTQPDHP